MSVVLLIARQEFYKAFHNWWIVGATSLLACLALVLTFLSSTPTGDAVAASPLIIVTVGLAGLTVLLVPLLALLLSFDAVNGEAALLLLLSFSVGRSQVLVGKFLGYGAVLGVSIILGYGSVGWIVGLLYGVEAGAWIVFIVLIVTSIMLGLDFSAFGLLTSVVVRTRATAAAVAIGLWLWFVVLHDMAVLGLLVSGNIQSALFHFLLLSNPADVFRILTLGWVENARTYVGLAEVTNLSPILLVVILGIWGILPLGFALFLFSNKEV